MRQIPWVGVALALSGAGALIAAQLPALLDGAIDAGDSAVFVHCGGVSDFQHLVVCGRPIVTAGFFWLTAADPWLIAILQHAISIVAWVGAALLASTLYRAWLARLAAFVGVLLIKLVFGLHTFDSFLMGDSIATSLTVIASVSALVSVIQGGRGALIAASISVPLCILSRDTHVWASALALPMLAAVWIYVRKDRPLRWRVLFVGGLIAAPIALYGALPQSPPHHPMGQRWVFPLLNSISKRILTDEDATAFFQARGMPVSDKLMALRGQWASGLDFAYYRDPALQDFRNWLLDRGKLVYVEWVLRTPTRQAALFLTHIHEVFLVLWTSPKRFAAVAMINPIVLVLVVSAAWGWLVAALALPESLRLLAATGCLMLVAFAHGFISYLGDPMDVIRHSVHANIQLMLSLVLTISAFIPGVRAWKPSAVESRAHAQGEII